MNRKVGESEPMRKAKKIFFPIVLMVIAFMYSCAENPKAGYINRKMRIAFDPPVGWIKTENLLFADAPMNAVREGFNRAFGRSHPQEIVHFVHKEGKNFGIILIGIGNVLPGEQDLREVAGETIEGLKSQYSDFKIITKKSRIVNGLQGYEFSYAGFKGRVNIRQKQVLLERAKVGYLIICTSLADNWSSLEPTFEKSIDSFRFLR